ncbi:MAG: SRPBCC family protein [Pseudomonadota bacterium]
MTETLAAGTNRAFYNVVTTTAEPGEIWRLWTDVTTWKTWDAGLKDAALDDAFAIGAKGRIIPLSGPSTRFEVTEYNAPDSYAFETRLPFARLVVRRSLVGANPTVFRHDVRFEGLLGGFWAGRFGPGFRAALPPTMDALVALAEKGASGGQSDGE